MGKRKVIISAVLSAVILAAFVLGLVLLILQYRDVNYLKDNLSKYIELSEKDYKNLELTMDFDEVDESDIDRKIMNLLYANRDTSPQYDGGNVTNRPVTVGDKVTFFYRGYTVDENGNETDIENASNLLGKAETLEIGSLRFIKGFEEGLIGKNPNDYEKFELINTGFVAPNDVIYLSYSAIFPNGTAEQKINRRIDLSNPNTDKLYGEGFKAFFEGLPSGEGKEIGKKISDNVTFKVEGGTAVYFDMTVNYVTRCEQNPLTVDVHFPMDYQEKSLRCADAKFDVYIEYVNIYNTPEYDEGFITDKLNIKPSDLASYSGDTLVEKHRSYLLSEAAFENEQTRRSLIEEAAWEHYNESVKIKKLPKSEVSEVCDEYYSEIKTAYEAYGNTAYSSIDDFAAYYLELQSGVDWREYISLRAESVVTEKLIFYYIVRQENLLPEKSVYEKLYNDTVDEYLRYYTEDLYKAELDAIKTEEERNNRISEIKKEMLNHYGSEYFEEMVYYDYAFDEIIGFITVSEK